MSFVFALDHKHNLPAEDLVVLVGGKAANLAVMSIELGLPVPPGFVVTTDACRAFLSSGWPEGLDQDLREGMKRLEAATGRGFGNPQRPLLLSVRSGAPVSMPGMMDTILNIGLNDETERGLAAMSGDSAFARDCRRRLEAMFTKTVGVTGVPDHVWDQLRAGIGAVFSSWNSARARAYRDRELIPVDLGTAVTVQAMVFGNWGADSATGVVFTRNPATGEPDIYGDVLFASQGEDVVAGSHRTEPLNALEQRLPRVARELRLHSASLERHFADLCDIEFTIERRKLWLLQVRVGKRSARAALRIAVDMAEAVDFPLSRAQAVRRVAANLVNPPLLFMGRSEDVVALASGVPASPGVATGEIATSPITAVTAAEAGRRVILVRAETSPDDVQGMARAAGVLTSRGGLASHAAVVARGWGIPAVVGAELVTVGVGSIKVGGRVLQAGETITIDGDTGEIFAGAVPTTSAPVPEAAKLLAWARELGIDVGSAGGAPEPAGIASQPATVDDVIRAVLIKGSATTDALAAGLLSTPELVRPAVEQLVDSGLLELFADSLRLTARGQEKVQELLAAEMARWGAGQARAALEGFHLLDQRMKDAVTAWQLRGVGRAQVLNDHTDPAYDAMVLDQLTGLHADTVDWLTALEGRPRQLDRYLERLTRARDLARGGDQRFIASPRVDSYHGVWFELHEELILLAGRTRNDEAAAGRA